MLSERVALISAPDESGIDPIGGPPF
jgi:hypothetical protein